MPTYLLISALLDKLTDYLKIRGDQLKVDVLARLAKVLAYAIVFVLIGFLGIFFLIFAGFTFSIYLNEVLESTYLGYLIVTGIIFLKLVIIFLLLKTGKVQKWLEKLLINIIDE